LDLRPRRRGPPQRRRVHLMYTGVRQPRRHTRRSHATGQAPPPLPVAGAVTLPLGPGFGFVLGELPRVSAVFRVEVFLR
jgi:hypothetical protein